MNEILLAGINIQTKTYLGMVIPSGGTLGGGGGGGSPI